MFRCFHGTDSLGDREAIGGYFRLDTGSSRHAPGPRFTLNSGRNALEDILRSRTDVRRLLLAAYVCPVLLPPLLRPGPAYSFYSIAESLCSPGLSVPGKDETLLVVNYLGLCHAQVSEPSRIHGEPRHPIPGSVP